MEKQITKRQHYVPRGYLKNFTNEENKVYSWDRESNKILEPERLENIAYEDFFYELDKDNPNNEVETALGLMENKCLAALNRVIRRLKDGNKEISRNEKKSLERFISVQLVRTPKNNEHEIETAERMIRALEEYTMSIYGEKYCDKLELDAMERKELLIESVKCALRLSDFLDKPEQISARYTTQIYINKTNKPLCTSDAPVVLLDEWIVYMCTLSNDVCITYTRGESGLCEVMPVSIGEIHRVKTVDRINKIVMEQCNKKAFGCSKECFNTGKEHIGRTNSQ